jgi:hypothetical protein
MPEIKQIIWEKVNQADISVLEKIISNNTNVFKAIETMINPKQLKVDLLKKFEPS